MELEKSLKLIKKAKNEKELIKEQNLIKKNSECLAVYDLPNNCEAMTFVTKNNWKTKEKEYKLFIFKK